MTKIKIVASGQSKLATNLALRSWLEPWFDIDVPVNPAPKRFDPRSTVVLASMWKWEDWQPLFVEQGFPLVIDNTWESWHSWRREYPENFDHGCISLVLQPQKWFWYNEYMTQQFGVQREEIQSYQPQRRPRYRALMQMNQGKYFRNRILNALGSRTQQMLWSYLAQRHHHLPGDAISTPELPRMHMRFFNPEWYDTTGFTLAVETYDDNVNTHRFGARQEPYHGPWPFVTEKTFKPLQYQHPFVIWGMANILATLRQWGFVSFDNLFDESYDSIQAVNNSDYYQNKLQIIVNNFDNFELGNYDAETQARIAHNHARFNNHDLVKSLFKQDIIDPIIEVVERGKN